MYLVYNIADGSLVGQYKYIVQPTQPTTQASTAAPTTQPTTAQPTTVEPTTEPTTTPSGTYTVTFANSLNWTVQFTVIIGQAAVRVKLLGRAQK